MSACSLESGRNTSLDLICVHTRHAKVILAVSAMNQHRLDLLKYNLSSKDCKKSHCHDCLVHRVKRSAPVSSSPCGEELLTNYPSMFFFN